MGFADGDDDKVVGSDGSVNVARALLVILGRLKSLQHTLETLQKSVDNLTYRN